MVKRGQVYWGGIPYMGEHVQCGYRPLLVVSNDKCNAYSPVIHVVPITSRKKKEMPTHVFIPCLGTAMCEMVMPVNKSILENKMAESIPTEIMKEIDRAIKVQLSIKEEPVE